MAATTISALDTPTTVTAPSTAGQAREVILPVNARVVVLSSASQFKVADAGTDGSSLSPAHDIAAGAITWQPRGVSSGGARNLSGASVFVAGTVSEQTFTVTAKR